MPRKSHQLIFGPVRRSFHLGVVQQWGRRKVIIFQHFCWLKKKPASKYEQAHDAAGAALQSARVSHYFYFRSLPQLLKDNAFLSSRVPSTGCRSLISYSHFGGIFHLSLPPQAPYYTQTTVLRGRPQHTWKVVGWWCCFLGMADPHMLCVEKETRDCLFSGKLKADKTV